MDQLHRDILHKLRKSIVDDVDVYNGIVYPLTCENVLREVDLIAIKSGITREERAEILLDILPSRGADAFHKFRKALKHHYAWLSDDMGKLLGETSLHIRDMGYCSSSPVLPPVSPMTVTREEKMITLKNALERLEPDEYVVLHGMQGFGKSCLAATALKDSELIHRLFNDKVYWLKFGYERPINEELLIQLNTLYHIAKNVDLVPRPLKPGPLKESLIICLKYHFSRNENRNALLVLDNVYKKEIIDTFDFGCKTLVTTSDITTVNGKLPTVIEMNHGFTEAEALDLFARVLEVEVGQLPPEAKWIYNECRGMPLLISMFAAQFKEFKHDMRECSDRWKYYLFCLQEKDTSNLVMKQFLEKQEVISEIYIKQLPSKLNKQYHDLVIFSKDVNIMPRTLNILWNIDSYKVEETMLELCHKSLAARQWNEGLNSYIYGIHGLLVCHLRKKLSSRKLMKMHRSFIEKYRICCKGDFSKLPNDNYSYSYIGRHLKHAGLFDEFPKLYLNFEFIQSKIIHTGLRDLLMDLSKYREYITKNYNRRYGEKVDDLKNFLNQQACIIADHRRKKCLDIVQIAMNYYIPGFVMDTAAQLAMTKSQYLYISHKKIGHTNKPLSEEITTEVSTLAFTNHPNRILIGNTKGEIILRECIYGEEDIIYGLHNENQAIKKIILSHDRKAFIALSNAGMGKLFLLKPDNYYEKYHRTQILKQKQTYWSNIFINNNSQDNSSQVYQIDNENISDITFGHDDNYIGACTENGLIWVWNRQGNIISRNNHQAQERCCLKGIAFTTQDVLLHVVDEVTGVLVTYAKTEEGYTYVSQYNPQLQNKKVIFVHEIPYSDNSLIIVTETKVIYVKWVYSNNHQQIHSHNKQQKAMTEDETTVFVCAALTRGGHYFILADSSGFINVYHMDVEYQPLATYKCRVTCLDIYCYNGNYLIIHGSDNKLLHRWELPVENMPIIIQKPQFDAVLRHNTSLDMVARETFANTVVVSVGDVIIAESDPADGKIRKMCLDATGSKLIYVTEIGTEILYDINNRREISLMRLPQPTDFVKILIAGDDVIVVSRELDTGLKVCYNARVSFSVEDVGFVISIHLVSVTNVVVVTREAMISVWCICNLCWFKVSAHTVDESANLCAEYSCVSKRGTILAILGSNKKLYVYKVINDNELMEKTVERYFTHEFPHKLTCCEISEDEELLAVGCDNGNILIISIPMQEQIHQLLLHNTAITQLYWAPSFIKASILLSVNSDELAWWNISLNIWNRKPDARNRISALFNRNRNLCLRAPDIPNVRPNLFNMQPLPVAQVMNEQTKLRMYWQSKVEKDFKKPYLLCVVQFPASCSTKICVASDFSRFLTVDIYGSVNTFKLIGYEY